MGSLFKNVRCNARFFFRMARVVNYHFRFSEIWVLMKDFYLGWRVINYHFIFILFLCMYICGCVGVRKNSLILCRI